MFEHGLKSASSSQALIACSHMYHVNLWRSWTVDTPRILWLCGHRIPVSKSSSAARWAA